MWIKFKFSSIGPCDTWCMLFKFGVSKFGESWNTYFERGCRAPLSRVAGGSQKPWEEISGNSRRFRFESEFGCFRSTLSGMFVQNVVYLNMLRAKTQSMKRFVEYF